jgi:S1-C subfamily serine protease
VAVNVPAQEATSTAQTAAAESSKTSIPTPSPAATTTSPVASKAQAKSVVSAATQTQAQTPASTQGSVGEAERVQDPYSSAPESFTDINAATRGALVNILCVPRAEGSLAPISGSGVIIDPRGVILTNAHVAQYVLLSESSQVDLSCFIRTGSPAAAHWSAKVLYIPSVWVQAHAADINASHPTGTGEHDYALLLITGSTDGSPLPSSFPFLPVDTREAVAFEGDQVIAVSYPAEFLGGLAAESDLYAVSTVTTIKQLLTFDTGTVDLLSLGGIIEAQGGSSGGAVVNAWGQLVGLIATTSGGDTTAQRDLRAVTMSYINRDLMAQTQLSLSAILNGDIATETADFSANAAPGLLQLYIKQLSQ